MQYNGLLYATRAFSSYLLPQVYDVFVKKNLPTIGKSPAWPGHNCTYKIANIIYKTLQWYYEMYGLNFMCGHKASTNRVVKGSLEWKDVWHNLAKDEWRKDGGLIERESVSCEPVSLSLLHIIIYLNLYSSISVWNH